jgi:hypothetical protein
VSECITSNVYSADFTFDTKLDGFDCFATEGVAQGPERFRQLGNLATELQFSENAPFAPYTPSHEESLVIGFLRTPPKRASFDFKDLKIQYRGKVTLEPSSASRATVTDLLNRTRYRELRRELWAAGRHSFYPRTPEDLNTAYRGSGLWLFRGPFFRYNVTRDNRIILTLDSTTHYVESRPFLEKLRTSEDIDKFTREIASQRQHEDAYRRVFRGVHFFYTLTPMDVGIDEVDLRHISQIPMDNQAAIRGVVPRNVAEFLRLKYSGNPKIGSLEDNQPGLKGRGFAYAPQFLHRTVSHEQVPNEIQNEQTFYMDSGPTGYGDPQRPAKKRMEIIADYFKRYGFASIALGPELLRFDGPLDYPVTGHFQRPKLEVRNGVVTDPGQLEQALTDGLYRGPKITKVFLYSVIDQDSTREFYKRLVSYAWRKYKVQLPDKPVPLEKDLEKMQTQLENSVGVEGYEGFFCIGIIPGESKNLHDQLTNAWGEMKMPSKCMTVPIVSAVVRDGKMFHLKDTLASMFARAKAIPWVLHDRLHYGCYAAVDVGRSLSEWWAMGIVYDREGKFTARQGKLMRGEDLDEQSIRHCISVAQQFSPKSESLIYLRQGDVYETERAIFERVIGDFQSYKTVGMVSVKERVPFRIFRRQNMVVSKPFSGDHYFLDQDNVIMCAAGGDEYQHGTPKPVVAEIIPVRGTLDSRKVVEDCFRLTYLNWGSPGRSYSVPAPLRLADEMARELGSGVARYGPPF